MPNRDFARSKPKKKGGNKTFITLSVILILVFVGTGLWLLKSQSPIESSPPPSVQVTPPKSTLPSRPEEVYSYIRDLETREVPIEKDAKLSQLTKEQELQIKKQQEEEKRRLEQLAALSQPVQAQTHPEPVAPQLSFEEKVQAEEEKRKQAEQKAQEIAKAKNEQVKVENAQVAAKNEEPVKSVEGRFGLQCGAFKNKAQAENMQARLAMAGFNAKIISSAEWNRVFVGPLGDRATAVKAQSNAKSVAECLVVSM